MKRFCIILLSVLVSLALKAQTRAELITREKIASNKIASVTQWTHKFDKNTISKKGTITVVTNYDKNGNPVQVINYRPDGSVSSRHEYKFDKLNRKIEYSQFQVPMGAKELKLTFKQTFSYDDKGNKRAELGFDGKTTYRITYSYINGDKQKEIVKYNAANSIEERWAFEHEQNLSTVTVYKPSTKVDRKIVRKYDSHSNLIDETNFSGAGKELGRTSFEFDAKGVLKSKLEYYAGKLRATYLYHYDKDGQLVEVYQVDDAGKKILYSAYKYDGSGNMIEEKWFDGRPGDYSKRNIKLDNKGNVNEVEAYYSDYNYKVVYRYTYKFN